MTFLEALAGAAENPELWFRPVAWRGVRAAYTVEKGEVLAVPSCSGGFPTMNRQTKYLLGEWELVTPDEVLE